MTATAAEREIIMAQKTQIGMGHIVRALQFAGFGHEEIMAMRSAMLNNNFSRIDFVSDCFSDDWDEVRAATSGKATATANR